MSRSLSILVTAAALGLTFGLPTMAQQASPVPPAVQSTVPVDSPVPGSEEWDRLRGETYRAVPDSRQDPNELEITGKLNAGIIAQNEEAARREAEIIASNDAAQEAWQAEVARIEADNARIAAENAAAQERYQRDMGLHEESVKACERASGKTCRDGP